MIEHVFRVEFPRELTDTERETVESAIRAARSQIISQDDENAVLSYTIHTTHRAKRDKGPRLYCGDCGRTLQGLVGGGLVCPTVALHPQTYMTLCHAGCTVECGVTPGGTRG